MTTTVKDFMNSDDIDRLIVNGYVRTYENEISYIIPNPIIDVIHRLYIRHVLETFMFRKSGNINKFSWKTKKWKIKNTEPNIEPFCICNIKKYIQSITNMDLISSKYISIVTSRESSIIISQNEDEIIQNNKVIYFYEVRHNDYINKQFGLYNNECKIIVVQFVAGDKKSYFLLKLPVNVKILNTILVNMAKSLFLEYNKTKKKPNVIANNEFKISHILMMDKKGEKTKIVFDEYITTDWDISNDIKIYVRVVVS